MTRVGLACQGGGSQNAFTAGALPAMLRDPRVEPVALTGTSGGAICALLAWYGLHTGGPDRAAELLAGFWRENTAAAPLAALANAAGLAVARTQEQLGIQVGVSPYLFPETARAQLGALIARWVDLDRLPALQAEPGPVLQVGAVEVLTGAFRRFDSRRGEITLDAILASAAIPTVFRAVHTTGGAYWDGVFSENPPVRDLPELGAEEIWIVQIYPRTTDREPRTPGQIADRRAELTSNLSLEQELDAIEKINEFVAAGYLDGTRYRHVDVARIELERRLDTVAALDRSRAFLTGLVTDGEEAARAFLASR